MTLFTNTAAVIILCAICALHFLNFVLPKKYSKIAVIVNITLHICLFIPILLEKTEIKDAALAYMISAFLYILLALVFYHERRGEDDV